MKEKETPFLIKQRGQIIQISKDEICVLFSNGEDYNAYWFSKSKFPDNIELYDFVDLLITEQGSNFVLTEYTKEELEHNKKFIQKILSEPEFWEI